MINLLEKLIGCKHERYSWPLGKMPNLTVCCLTCGKPFKYDWKNMRVLPEPVPRKKVVQMVRNVLTERE